MCWARGPAGGGARSPEPSRNDQGAALTERIHGPKTIIDVGTGARCILGEATVPPRAGLDGAGALKAAAEGAVVASSTVAALHPPGLPAVGASTGLLPLTYPRVARQGGEREEGMRGEQPVDVLLTPG
jgi:hypothetical protein